MTTNEQSKDVGPATDMLYMSHDGISLQNCEAVIVAVERPKDGAVNNGSSSGVHVNIVLNQTIMHAQGGGQPTDFGTITKRDNNGNTLAVVQVTKVMLDRESGIATHAGVVVQPTEENNNHDHSNDNDNQNDASSHLPLQPGDVVQVQIDSARRQVMSECHTAGHLVDAAMARCGKDHFKPIKAYHFLEGPYVEYNGTLDASKNETKDTLLQQLQTAFVELVEQDLETTIQTLSKEDAMSLCNNNSDVEMLSDNVRVVTVAGVSCPCGGTHVQRTSDLKDRGWKLTGIKSKKGKIQVKYKFDS